jgi:hypothetical protein
MVNIEHWPSEGTMRIDFLDGPDDYGHEVAPGIICHYRRVEGEDDDLLVRVEIIDDRRGRDLSEIHVEERDENGNVALPAMIAKTLEELQRRGLIEQVKAADTEKPKEMQKR